MISELIKAGAKDAVGDIFHIVNALRGSTDDGRCNVGCRGCDGTAYCALRTAMLSRRDIG